MKSSIILVALLVAFANGGHVEWVKGNVTNAGTYNGNAFYGFQSLLAIAYSNGASGNTYFQVSTDTSGYVWSVPATMVNEGANGIASYVRADNTPISVASSTSASDLLVTGGTLSGPQQLATIDVFDRGVQNDIFSVGGNPFIVASINSNPDEIYSAAASDAQGTTWGSPESTNTVLGAGNFYAAEVNGAAAFVAPVQTGDVRFKRYNNGWSSSGISVGAPLHSAPHDLKVMAGVPIVLYGTSTSIYVAWGNDADGSSFAEPELVWAYGVFYELNAARLYTDPQTMLPVVVYSGKAIFGGSRVISTIRRSAAFGEPGEWTRDFPVVHEVDNEALVYGNNGMDVAATSDGYLSIAVSAQAGVYNWIEFLTQRATAPTTARPTTAAPTSLSPTTESPTTLPPSTDAPTVATTGAPTTSTTDAPTAGSTTAAPTTNRGVTTAAPTVATTGAPTTTAAPTVPATTAAPTNSPTVTPGSPTAAPTTAAPTTIPPTTDSPTTESPTTMAPTILTDMPTTNAPTSDSPTSFAPTTLAPTTDSPTTHAPTTHSPTSLAPTDASQSGQPTTFAPTSHAPTSLAPTTDSPTTLSPTTLSPTTDAPTEGPPTVAPGTSAPTETPTTSGASSVAVTVALLVVAMLM